MPVILPPATLPSGLTVTLARVYSEIRTRLGGGLSLSAVDVELDDADILVCLSRALRTLNRHRPRRNRAVLTGASSQVRRYEITAHPAFHAITRVFFLANVSGGTNGAPDAFDPLLNGILAYNYGQDGTASYARYIASFQDAQIVFGADPSWHAEREASGAYCLYLYLPTQPTYYVGYEFLWHVTPDDGATGVSKINPTDVDWVLDYTEACAKFILGRRRGKFGGIPDANDGTSEIDGATLLSEAADGQLGIVSLTEKIQARRRPFVPGVG